VTFISYTKPPHLGPRERIGRLAAATATSGMAYSVELINQSDSPWLLFSYQQIPNEQSDDMFSVVWFCSPFEIVPTAAITFTWTTDYDFVWGISGNVEPGITFSAGEFVPADPQSANTTDFSTAPGPNLSAAAPGSPQGSLVISDAATVPNDTFLVGIGMGGAGTIVTAAGPNLQHTFTPTPTYWIAAGTGVRVGTILDAATVTQNLQVIFPVNVYEVTCVLGANNEWTQSP
jgi:hypothetical protein